MNILAIDTANEYLAIAVNSKQQSWEQYLLVGNRQSEYLLPEIKKVLTAADLNLNDINAIAYNQGPGSFTGLRIGLSCALGLAYSLKCPLIPIPAFAIYSNALNYQNIIVVLDARLGQIYVAGINKTNFKYIIKPCLITPEELAEIISAKPQLEAHNTCLTGPGVNAYLARISPELISGYPYENQAYPRASNLLELAQSNAFDSCPAFAADLLYIRNKVALNITEQKLSKQACK